MDKRQTRLGCLSSFLWHRNGEDLEDLVSFCVGWLIVYHCFPRSVNHFCLTWARFTKPAYGSPSESPCTHGFHSSCHWIGLPDDRTVPTVQVYGKYCWVYLLASDLLKSLPSVFQVMCQEVFKQTAAPWLRTKPEHIVEIIRRNASRW